MPRARFGGHQLIDARAPMLRDVLARIQPYRRTQDEDVGLACADAGAPSLCEPDGDAEASTIANALHGTRGSEGS